MTRNIRPLMTLLPLTALVMLGACGRGRDAREVPATPSSTAAPAATNEGVTADQPMAPTRTILDNAAATPSLSSLVAAIRAASLATTLAGPGPYTLFAPSNAAFSRLAPGVQEQLLQPANHGSLVRLLRFHMLPGVVTVSDLQQRIAAGGGTATIMTVQGEPLTLSMTQSVITLTDASGNKSYIEAGDLRQANGMIHIVNGVLVPKLD
ncbi:fasciclin domain-containing protein [Sphingomonas pseudosanguinis]|uniref:Putative surface protein with fasciclin (FAS1) repeats n=1 Tax=Sphingomonas pseudosanguinis TaxID=413712 RepID=A0A7W6ABI3_9SPHN|nr:fasciclin domain-containing protein [Sphingomonas pseudosanguinis]MBB3878770.1 putative surface protein with fasciclin (FAS1) repeats [Sphingomonas pseudosanguinis]